MASHALNQAGRRCDGCQVRGDEGAAVIGRGGLKAASLATKLTEFRFVSICPRGYTDVPRASLKAFSPEIQAFIQRNVAELVNGTAAAFLGAGMSVEAGYVNWKGLLKDVADELELDIDRETNLVALAQYHVNERNSRSVLNQKILDEFTEHQTLTPSHHSLARLPIRTYWTTNYDRLIETALEHQNRRPDVKYAVDQLKRNRPGRDAVVYKMHGDVEHPEGAILTKDDYEGYFREHEPFVTALSGDLAQKTLLFLGFSFSDPNIDYVMSRVRVTLRKQPKHHYCIMRSEHRAPREALQKFEYRQRQQAYLIKDLCRLGIQTLLVDEYRHVPQILAAIEEHYRRRTVFISGSASEFRGNWSHDRAHEFVSELSAQMIRKKLTIVTGFGIGVGPAVVSGALQVILTNPGKYPHSQLKAHPFPVDATNAQMQKRMFRSYREDMVGQAGIALYLFGNKRDARGPAREADGVLEEFACAQAAGVIPIPVGATGDAAQTLWQRVSREFASFYPHTSKAFAKHFQTLGRPTASNEQLISAVLSMVQELRNLAARPA